MKASIKTIIGGIACLACSANLSSAATRYVDINNPVPVAPYTTWATAATDIQTAIDVAVSNDVVLVADGIYNIVEQVSISSSVTLRSINGSAAVTVDAGGNCRGIHVANLKGPLTMEGFTITGGMERNGGGLNVIAMDEYAVHISDFVLEGNVATNNGGGVYIWAALNSSAPVTMQSCVIRNNDAEGRGGGVYAGTSNTSTAFIRILNSDIHDNVAALSGGGAEFTCFNNTSMIEIAHCDISGNTADKGGGLKAFANNPASLIRVLDCRIEDNHSVKSGGGAWLVENIEFRDSTVKGNQSDGEGGGIWCNAPNGGLLDIIDCIVEANSASGDGGGINANRGTNITVHSCLVVDNSSLKSGGGLWLGDNVTMTHCTITENSADEGGGVSARRNGVIENCAISKNTANKGGGIYCFRGGAFTGCAIESNSAQYGGGIYCDRGGTVNDCTLTGNWANKGGGIYCFRGGAFAECAIESNRAQYGGGIYCQEGGAFNECAIGSNTAVSGGGIYCDQDGTVNDCTITGNRATDYGAGIYCDRGGTANDCTLTGNRANKQGGGARCYRGGVFNYCTFIGNSAYNGGGIKLQEGGTLNHCTIRDNWATSNGGGVNFYQDGMLKNCILTGNSAEYGGGVILSQGGILDNCIISGNTAAANGGGVKIYLGGILKNCTVSQNWSPLGGGVFCNSGGFVVNSIMWNNSATTGANWHNHNTTMNYSYCSTTPDPGGSGNIAGDPLFVASDNYRLLATSPCIDAGNNAVVFSGSDLDGNPRIMDGDFDGYPVVDMGAYEFPVISVKIDIKPGAETNVLNLKSKGRCPVAILTTEEFDAADVDPATVRFSGAAAVHAAYEDVDADGDLDLILHFKIQELNLTNESTLAVLFGQTYGGEFLVDSESFVFAGKKEPPPPPPSSGMVAISAGTNNGFDPDFGAYSLTVDAFHIAAIETPKEIWDTVYAWAITNGYSFTNPGQGKESDHPVNRVNWYDCAKWCNALSEMEGLAPCYTVGGIVCREGETLPACDFSANGYRLPTNTEWEYAARGGLVGARFAWGNTITHSDANYLSAGGHSYDLSPTSGYHPTYYYGAEPYTSPVGSFAPNGYGLHDVSGNLREWVDITLGSVLSLRGGGWVDQADYNRIGPSLSYGPTFVGPGVGFRVAQTVIPE